MLDQRLGWSRYDTTKYLLGADAEVYQSVWVKQSRCEELWSP